jgi:hypothetical protein
VIEPHLDPKEEQLGRRLVTFELPKDPTPAEVSIAKDFVSLDHRSMRMLGQATPERGEVRDLLLNVAVFPAHSGHGRILDVPVTTTRETCP